MDLNADLVDDYVHRALHEDLEDVGDVTTRLAIREPRVGRARIIAKELGVLAGIVVAERTFVARDIGVRLVRRREDGERVAPGDVVLEIHGDVGAMLEAERTALNFLQRLSGIATITRAFVDAVEGTGASILDTRKTTPTLRVLEKYAVRVGGGVNHRFGLFDQVLLKENHFARAGEPYEAVVDRIARSPSAAGLPPIVAEARTVCEAAAAVRSGAGIVMLDNFDVPDGLRDGVEAVREAARVAHRTVQIEASGGVTLDTVRSFAGCGVDRISVGALTHSARSLDLSMLIHPEDD